ncbi:hypothetical protein A3850_017700 [Lewinella sp. 4G2]|nr:hypothetical protein A3850_017700 [Lewinella sp. 4G2]
MLTTTLFAQTQDEKPWYEDWTVKPIFAVQTWGTYTIGHEDYDPASDTYVEADNRLNFMLRRLRFGTTAQVGDRLFIKFLGAADFVGSDQRSGTVGGVNNGGFPNAQVWDIYSQYKISRNSEALYVIGGYMRPPIGRESMSGAMGVSSFEKSWTQWYVRQHLVGTGPGGAGGAYLGGLVPITSKLHLDYRAGVFNAQNNGITAGRLYSSLYVSRLNFMFGDPEKSTWSYGLPAANSFGRRNTAAIALNLASEGPTGAAEEGISLVGVDALVNFGHFHLEGEYHSMRRSSLEDDYTSATYAVRAGYNIVLDGDDPSRPRYLEPSVMVYGFDGTTSLEDYPTVVATSFFGGTETVYDVGINYHLKPGKVRLGLHYVGRSGEIGNLPADGRLSWNNMQSGLPGIRRGDYVGFEVILAY